MILETERLVLRKLEQSDFREACKLLQDPEGMYAYEGAYNNQEVQEWRLYFFINLIILFSLEHNNIRS